MFCLGRACLPPLSHNRSKQPRSADLPLLGRPDLPPKMLTSPPSPTPHSPPPHPVCNLSTTVPVAHKPVPLSAYPLALLQLISGPGTPVAPQRSNTALPRGDLRLATPGRISGLWHFLSSSWLRATPARLRGLAHFSLASMKARFGAQPSRKRARS